MEMRRLITICTLALSAVALLGLAPGVAAAKKAPVPQITKVSPMRVNVGKTITIRGRHFKSKRSRNTVIFRNSAGRTVFAKPRRASSTKLVVVVPAGVTKLIARASGEFQPTRMTLRVLAGKFSKWTSRRFSPVIVAPKGLSQDAACGTGNDWDHDLLPNSLEVQIKTDPCVADTDGDQMTDGWEYYSAKDLNIKAVPYPGKRPFPNALDPSDGGGPGATFSAYDFDGDGLTTLEEYRAWRVSGSSFIASKAGGTDLESALGYSDGTKFSRAGEAPSVPLWRSASFGLSNPTQPFPSTEKLFGDGLWHDQERDADADGLNNRMESARGPSKNSWWESFWANDKHFSPVIKPWGEQFYCSPSPPQSPGFFDQRPFADLDLADPDVDGDGLLDGEDDQDNDDYSNIVELYETEKDLDANGQPAWCGYPAAVVPTINVGGIPYAINAFNPCAPNPNSRTCDDYVPF
jgi:IPT/TIG domain